MTFTPPKLPVGWKWLTPQSMRITDISKQYIVRAIRQPDGFILHQELIVDSSDNEKGIEELFQYVADKIAKQAYEHIDNTTQDLVLREILQAFSDEEFGR